MEKKPRRIDETGRGGGGGGVGAGEDNYYPSGDRDRRPGQERPFGNLLKTRRQPRYKEGHLIADSGDTRDSWADSDRDQPPQQREETHSREDLSPSFPLEPLQPLEPLEPHTEEAVLEPVRTDRPRPRLEDGDGWAAQRKPWLPDINTDIKSFEDIFGNVVDSYAEPRTSGAPSQLLENVKMLVLCGLLVILGRASQ